MQRTMAIPITLLLLDNKERDRESKDGSIFSQIQFDKFEMSLGT